jgi:catechol 2,3-dioxygenase-like lactoylglutathione lyase family enzyme
MKRTLAVLAVLLVAALTAKAQDRPAITGIAFVRMYSAVPPSDAFYGKTLGYTKVSGADGIARYAVNPAQWLEVQPLPATASNTRVAEVAFATRNLAAMERYLVKHKVAIEKKQKNSFTVLDPEGNLIGFVQQGTGAKLPASPTAISHRIIHAGFIVRDRAAEDSFYLDLLGFHLYWQGGPSVDRTNWVSIQVPDGTDWLEYMLNTKPDADAHTRGVMNHFSLGVEHMSDAVAALERNGCSIADCGKSQMGRDGKVQLNLYDPDLTRVEFMEFKPSGTICCSEFKGRHPAEVEDK